MLGFVDDPLLAEQIGALFGGAAADIREHATVSGLHEKDGERAAREDAYTEKLVHSIRTSVKARLQELSAGLSERGAEVRVEFHAPDMPMAE